MQVSHERKKRRAHMAAGAGGVISTPLLLAVLIAAAATANAPTTAAAASAGSVHQAGGGSANSRAGMSASPFIATAAVATRKTIGHDRECRRRGHPAAVACSGGEAGERRLVRCCGGRCTDVLASAGNCGACGKRCPFGRLCCGGRCVAVADDVENCGACGRACAHGIPCTYMCGYA